MHSNSMYCTFVAVHFSHYSTDKWASSKTKPLDATKKRIIHLSTGVNGVFARSCISILIVKRATNTTNRHLFDLLHCDSHFLLSFSFPSLFGWRCESFCLKSTFIWSTWKKSPPRYSASFPRNQFRIFTYEREHSQIIRAHRHCGPTSLLPELFTWILNN